MAIADILNFIQVNETTALGGQPSEEQFRSARDAGYDVVINLAPADPNEGALPEESEFLERLGFEFHHIPVPWSAPTVALFDEFCGVMDGVGDRHVLIHCAANFRVTAFYSLYAMQRLGWDQSEADGLMDRVWKLYPDITMDDTWKSFIADVQRPA